MPELNLNTNQAVSSTQAALQKKPASRWKRTTAAGLLSFLIPGMGQLYNRQPRKALWMALTFPVLAILAVQSRLLFSFLSMVAFFAALIVWRLFIAAEATYSAWAAKKPEATPPLPRLTYPVAAVVLVLAALYPSPDQFKRWTSFGAFKVPSASMCPTICLGERFVADMGAYKSGPPQRGDLILLKHKSSEGLFIKRVIGIPGDVVAPGANGSILINGKPLTSPEVCGISPIQEEGPSADYPMFKSIKSLKVPSSLSAITSAAVSIAASPNLVPSFWMTSAEGRYSSTGPQVAPESAAALDETLQNVGATADALARRTSTVQA